MTLEVAIFLSMNGKAKEAIDFYIRTFNAKSLMVVTYGDLAQRDPDFKMTEENRRSYRPFCFANWKNKGHDCGRHHESG